jgi:pectate lyase
MKNTREATYSANFGVSICLHQKRLRKHAERLAGSRRALCAWLLVAFLSPLGGSAHAAGQSQIAFPGAEGYGKMALGGRGGAIVPVTNLDDSGPGSLRECVEMPGPRNCVFRVSGVIHLIKTLAVKGNGRLSILGQTAPGGGVLVTIDRVNSAKQHTPLLVKRADDVIIRHIRVRPRFSNAVRNVDGLTVEDSRRVYVDHVSTSWATDENFNAYSNTSDLTVAYSVFGEGLNKHSKCALLGSDPGMPQNISFWSNACISNRDRNPDDNHYGKSCIEIVNNVFFNAASEWGEVFSQRPGGTPIAFVGNYFKAGPSTNDVTYAINWNDTNSAAAPQIYQTGNVTWSPKGKSVVLIAPDTEQHLVDKPPCPLAISKVTSAEEAYEEVSRRAGAFPRDGVDERLIEGLAPIGTKGRGKMVREPGELPEIAQGEPYVDADGDGMADGVESQFGAKPGANDAWEDSDEDGWTNFDEFMQWLSEERVAGRYPQ